jgi:hypothetical protein
MAGHEDKDKRTENLKGVLNSLHPSDGTISSGQ